MRQMTWIRTGLASVILAGGAGGMFAIGCSGDDNVVAPKDAGKDVTAVDTGITTPDTGTDAGTTDAPADVIKPPPHAKIIVVHASPDAPPIRLCFGTGQAADGSDSKVSPLPALPHFAIPPQPFPGLYPGTGGPLPDITDLSTVVITGYVIPAQSIAAETGEAGAEKTCDTLLGQTGAGGTLAAGSFFKLAPIAKGTFATSTTQLIAAVGCLPGALDPTANVARCGATWTTATGNIAAKIFSLDQTVADPTKMGVQVVHAASAFEGVLSALNPPGVLQVTAFATPPPDSGVISLVNPPPAGIKYGQKLPDPAAPQAATTIALSNYFGVTAIAADGGTAAQFGLPLGAIAQLSNGVGTAADGGPYFTVGENYTFVLLGDPTAPDQLPNPDGGGGINPNWKGYGLHIIAFPNNLALPKFQ